MKDYLTVDPEIPGQKFFVLSYALSNKCTCNASPAVIKVRGSYSTVKECEERIEQLETHDKAWEMYICKVGYFGGLFDHKELLERDDIKVTYREEKLNELARKKEEIAKQKDEEFIKRKHDLLEQAKIAGTKEGQEKLSEAVEHPVAVKSRIDDLIKRVEEIEIERKQAKKDLKNSKKKYASYTPEEIEAADKEYEELMKKYA